MKYLLIFFLLSSATIRAQDKNEELIDWSASYRLTWVDYKGSPNPTSDAAATTTTYVGVEYNIRNNLFDYSIHCRFSRDRSWGLHKTAYILSHEQGHFDIAEIFARRLHQALSDYEFNEKTYANDLKKIYDKVMKDKEEWQRKYDKETNHSINKEKQAEWLKTISTTLNELANFADYK